MASEYYLNVFRDYSAERTHLNATGKKIVSRHHETSHASRQETLEEIIDLNGYAGLQYDHTLHVDGDKAEVLDLLGEACALAEQKADEYRDHCRLRGYVLSGAA